MTMVFCTKVENVVALTRWCVRVSGGYDRDGPVTVTEVTGSDEMPPYGEFRGRAT